MEKRHIAGNSLLSILFFMIVLGLLMFPIMNYYDNWKSQKRANDTVARLETINKTIREFAATNGHYPCPANIRAGLDTPNFGKSAASECNTGSPGAFSGQTKRSGKAKPSGAINYVRAGAVPVRTLGLPDEYIYDGYSHRYVYVVTEAYAAVAADGTLPNIPELDRNDSTGVFIEDINENTSTRKVGNAIYAVMSMGNTIAGSYSANGNLLADCPTGVANCSLEATLQNTISTSDAEGPDRFTQTVRYDTPQPCIISENTPDKIAFLLDTSGSMGAQGGELNIRRLALTDDDIAPNPIWRVHPAQWAFRRALIARNVAMSPVNDPDGRYETTISSFRTGNNPINFRYGDYSDSDNSHVEDVLRNPLMCPLYGAGTPLGQTIRRMSDEIRGGTSGSSPNKIIALVDGGGDEADIVNALNHIRNTYGPTLQVNFIDVANTEAIPNAIRTSGVTSATATYVRTSDPDDLIYQLLHSTNGCSIFTVPEPLNERYYCTPPTCEEMGNCPEPEPEPTCEELGNCPTPTCEELGNCPTPTCEELGNCPTPTCEQSGTCPPDPITFSGWIQVSLPVSAPRSLDIAANTFKLQGYNGARGSVNEIGFDRTNDGVENPTYQTVRSGGTTVNGNQGRMNIRPNGDFVFTSNPNSSGSELFYIRGVVTNPGPSNGISVAPFPMYNLGGSAQLSGNMYSVIDRLNQVMSRLTMVEVNGVEHAIPATGDLTVSGTNSTLTINQSGQFTIRGISGRSGGDYYYLKGPILESGEPLVIRDPVPTGVANSYRWDINFTMRNGNGGKPLTGHLRYNERGITVENVIFNGVTHRMTGERLRVEGQYGVLTMRRDGYFSYRANTGATGRDDFRVNGIEVMP